jgi:hypothetical protein
MDYSKVIGKLREEIEIGNDGIDKIFKEYEIKGLEKDILNSLVINLRIAKEHRETRVNEESERIFQEYKCSNQGLTTQGMAATLVAVMGGIMGYIFENPGAGATIGAVVGGFGEHKFRPIRFNNRLNKIIKKIDSGYNSYRNYAEISAERELLGLKTPLQDYKQK